MFFFWLKYSTSSIHLHAVTQILIRLRIYSIQLQNSSLLAPLKCRDKNWLVWKWSLYLYNFHSNNKKEMMFASHLRGWGFDFHLHPEFACSPFASGFPQGILVSSPVQKHARLLGISKLSVQLCPFMGSYTVWGIPYLEFKVLWTKASGFRGKPV